MAGFAFVSSNFEGTPARTAEADPFWCRIDEIPYDEMWENDRIWLPRVLRGERIRAGLPVLPGSTRSAHGRFRYRHPCVRLRSPGRAFRLCRNVAPAAGGRDDMAGRCSLLDCIHTDITHALNAL